MKGSDKIGGSPPPGLECQTGTQKTLTIKTALTAGGLHPNHNQSPPSQTPANASPPTQLR